jgi:hypothetical protein
LLAAGYFIPVDGQFSKLSAFYPDQKAASFPLEGYGELAAGAGVDGQQRGKAF